MVGGWDIHHLMNRKDEWKEGLLVEAKDKLFYVDEINLLDDHIVNSLLDVTATGKLVVARESKSETYDVPFTLVGTMNPEEGGVRPQLLDRFALRLPGRDVQSPDRTDALSAWFADFISRTVPLRRSLTWPSRSAMRDSYAARIARTSA